jgi:lipopolysaccharide transport system permease protein
LTDQVNTIWRFRHFWLSLVQLDLRLRYRRSVLGIGWSLLNPILMTVVFCVVFSHLNGELNWKQAAPRYLAGLAIWEYLKQSTFVGCQTFFRNECYIRQCPLPLSVYTLRSVLGATIHFGIAIGVALLAIVVLNPSNALKSLSTLYAVIPAIVLLIIFAWAITVLTAFFNVLFQDTQQIAEVTFQIAFFLTPILYSTELLYQKGLWFLAELNPVVTFLELIRAPLVSGEVPHYGLYLRALAIDALFVGCALTTIKKLEKKLIFHL